MDIETHEITVRDVTVQVVRKAIKNLHLGVYPPDGRVRVAAPLVLKDEAVRLAVIGRLAWIKRQQAKFEAQPRQSEREMVSGESHYFLGRRYRLRVYLGEGPATVRVGNRSFIDLHVPPSAGALERQRVVQTWYRRELRRLLPPLLDKWQRILGVEIAGYGIKKMKTKWGTCNAEDRRIWLNLELAKKSVQCIEYVLLHELVHLRERHHNDRFTALLNKHLPHWQSHRHELNLGPLAHEIWS